MYKGQLGISRYIEGKHSSKSMLPILRPSFQPNWLLERKNQSNSPVVLKSIPLKVLKNKRETLRRTYARKYNSYYDVANLRTIDSLIGQVRTVLHSPSKKYRPVTRLNASFLRKMMKHVIKPKSCNQTLQSFKTLTKPIQQDIRDQSLATTYNFIGQIRATSRQTNTDDCINQTKYREITRGIEKIRRVIIFQRLPRD